MTQLTENFSLAEMTISETAKKMGISNKPNAKHADNLWRTAHGMEFVRALLGHPIRVTSAYRSPAVNKAVGGVPNSDHALGWAVDFQCPDFGDPFKVCRAIAASNLKFDQLIHERKPNGSWWVHISFNPRFRRQLLTYNGARYTPGITPVNFR